MIWNRTTFQRIIRSAAIAVIFWFCSAIAIFNHPAFAGNETIRQAEKALRHDADSEYIQAREIWIELAKDKTCPIQHHARHLAAQAGIRSLTTKHDLSDDEVSDLQSSIMKELKSLAQNTEYSKNTQAQDDLLRFLLDTRYWTELLAEIPAAAGNTLHRYMRAKGLFHLNRIEEAESVLRALWLNPAHSQLIQEIDTLYQRARIELDKPYPGISTQQLYERARALDRIGRRHEAADTYQQVIESNPGPDMKANATLFKAKILYDTFQNDECMSLYHSFLNDFPGHLSTATVLMRRSIVYRRMQNDQKYLEMVNRVEQNYPGSSRLNGMLVGRGDYWRSRHEWDKAEADYRKVMRSGGDDRDQAWWKWAWTAFNRGDPNLASERMTQMMAHYAGTGWDRPMRYWRARFRDLAGSQADNDVSEYRRLAADFGWEYYGILAAERLNQSVPEPVQDQIPEMTPDENRLQAVKAAQILERLELWDRASVEWDAAFSKIRQPSGGLVLNRLNGLVNTGKVPVARRHVLQQFGSRVNNGDIPVTASHILYPFPAHLRRYYNINARLKDIDPVLAVAVTLQESGFDQKALSHNLAGGLMQIMPQLFARLSAEWPETPDPDQYMLPRYNIRAGVEYLAWLLDRYDGSIPKALAAYNAGEHRVDNWIIEYQYPDEIWIEHIPFRQTRLFVKKVLENYACYSAIYRQLNDISETSDLVVPEKE